MKIKLLVELDFKKFDWARDVLRFLRKLLDSIEKEDDPDLLENKEDEDEQE